MASVQEIERAVTGLPGPQFVEFRLWFEKYCEDVWDKQFVEDVHAGKLDHLANQALKDVNEGRTTKL